MKSFNTVYKKERNTAINEQKSILDNDYAKLIAAVKREYSVNDFSKLTETEKNSFRSIINEMWDRERGLTEKGVVFINEAMKPLTETSSDEDIDNRIIKLLKANADKILEDIVAGRKNTLLLEVKSNVEKDTKKKLSKKRYAELVGKVICPVLGKRINTALATIITK